MVSAKRLMALQGWGAHGCDPPRRVLEAALRERGGHAVAPPIESRSGPPEQRASHRSRFRKGDNPRLVHGGRACSWAPRESGRGRADTRA
jgi:hypothetical protein